jgi:hypothetical protein
MFDSANHTRFPKEYHLPDCASRDNQVKKGDRVDDPFQNLSSVPWRSRVYPA